MPAAGILACAAHLARYSCILFGLGPYVVHDDTSSGPRSKILRIIFCSDPVSVTYAVL